MFELRNCNEAEKANLLTHDINPSNIKVIDYFGSDIYFYDVRESKVANHDYWVNYTGLRSKRPNIIIDTLKKEGVLSDDSRVLDLGCGLSELGIEMRRQFNNIKYLGIDVNKRLIDINNINFSLNDDYKFKVFELTSSNPDDIKNTYDTVITGGAEDNFFKIFHYISEVLKPTYIVCESHIKRNYNLIEIVEACKGYNIKTTSEYSFTSVNGPGDPNWVGYKRKIIILERLN